MFFAHSPKSNEALCVIQREAPMSKVPTSDTYNKNQQTPEIACATAASTRNADIITILNQAAGHEVDPADTVLPYSN